MGYCVKAECYIEVYGLTKKLFNQIKKMVKDEGGYDFKFDEEYKTIDFVISGNKNVDYSILDRIKKLLKKNKCSLIINAIEWIESDGGYYYNSEDD